MHFERRKANRTGRIDNLLLQKRPGRRNHPTVRKEYDESLGAKRMDDYGGVLKPASGPDFFSSNVKVFGPSLTSAMTLLVSPAW